MQGGSWGGGGGGGGVGAQGASAPFFPENVTKCYTSL